MPPGDDLPRAVYCELTEHHLIRSMARNTVATQGQTTVAG